MSEKEVIGNINSLTMREGERLKIKLPDSPHIKEIILEIKNGVINAHAGKKVIEIG